MNTVKTLIYKDLTGEIIDSACTVHNTLGCGLLEKIHENSLAWELELRGKKVTTQKKFAVVYKNKEVGIYYADLIIDDKVIVEVKSVDEIIDTHRAQMLNYSRISKIKVGLLMNFAKPKLKYERYVI